jgi:hypothetical protein
MTYNEATGLFAYFDGVDWWQMDATKMSPQP